MRRPLLLQLLVFGAIGALQFSSGAAHAAEPEALAVAASAATAPSSDADVVETIDADAPPSSGPPNADAAPPAVTPAPPAPAAPAVRPPAAPLERFELHGWARQSLEVGLRRSPQPNDAQRTLVPSDQLIGRSQLFMRARYSRGHWFEANVSGALSYSLFEQGPAQGRGSFNGFNGQSARGVLEPRLQELYIGLFTSRLDVRIGQQRLAWGNSDFMSPNDVMNARDLRDPFVSETELRRIPTFLLRADLDLGFASLQGVIEPVFTPDRYDVYGSNWAGIQADAPSWARGIAGLARRSLDPTVQEPAQQLLLATRYPKSDFTEPVVGARLSWSAGGIDLNYYYQYGFDGPLIAIDPKLAASLGSIDFERAGLVDLEPWLAAIDAGGHPLDASYVRRHHAGFDLATAIGPFAIRVDAAYDSKRVFFRRDLLGSTSPTVQAVLSTEYETGDKDKLLLLELVYLHLIEAPAAPLLLYDRNTFGGGADLRWPLWRALGVELRGVVGAQPRTFTLQPELNLKLNHWLLSGGALWLDGDAYSLGGHFRRNTEAYAKAKLLF